MPQGLDGIHVGGADCGINPEQDSNQRRDGERDEWGPWRDNGHHLGKMGDGKIFIYEVYDAIRISTGQRGADAIIDHKSV